MEISLSQTVPSRFQKTLLLTAVFTYILAVNFSPLLALGDYTFRDENYEEIILPERAVIDMNKPGTLLNEAPAHTPRIQVKARREGLEKIRMIEFEFPETRILDASGKDRRQAVYLLDKDGQVIGYHALKSTEPRFRININSVINYIRVYVECTEHGLWFEEFNIRS